MQTCHAARSRQHLAAPTPKSADVPLERLGQKHLFTPQRPHASGSGGRRERQPMKHLFILVRDCIIEDCGKSSFVPDQGCLQ